MKSSNTERLERVLDHLERLAEKEYPNALAGFYRYADGYANVREAEEADQGANLQRVYDELQELRRNLAEDFFEQDVHRMLDQTDQLLRSVEPKVGRRLGTAAIGLARWIGKGDEEAGKKAQKVIAQLRDEWVEP